MNSLIKPIDDDLNYLSKHANDLVSATAEATEERIVQAKKRLADVITRGKKIYSCAGESASAPYNIIDLLMRKNLYPVIAISIGAGLPSAI